MKKRTILSLGLALMLMLNPISVLAADNTPVQENGIHDKNEEILPIVYDSNIEIKEQIPTELDFPTNYSMSAEEYKVGDNLDLQAAEIISGPVMYDVIAGRAQDYLTGTGEMKTLELSINPGVYLQAQLTQPALSTLDYDLYILDAEGYILAGSENITHINGTSGTLVESVGYITGGTEAATYYLAVYSANGGSVNDLFTLDYAVSNVCDQLEPSENAMASLPFTFSTGGSQISTATLSAPIDNDWYSIDIPEERIYDELILNISTESTNTCRFEVYQNVNTSGYYEMVKIASSASTATVSVSAGTYYVRVCNDKTVEDYNENDIQAYTFSIIPKLQAEGIVVTEYNGNEGVNHFVQYPGYSRTFFRTEDWIQVTGYVTATDPETSEVYGISNHSVTAEYRNKNWEANNTPDYAIRTGIDITDDTGLFTIRMDLPPAMGVLTYNTGLTTQYFDLCDFDVKLTEQSTICYEDEIVHYKYSLYN